MSLRPVACLLAATLLSGGCASLFATVEPPDVYVINVQPAEGESGLLEQRLKVDLRIRNPNDHDLNVNGMDFFLDVNGNRLARGLSNESVTVPRLGEARISVIASSSLIDMVRQVTGLGQHQALEYVVKGRLHLGDGWGRPLAFESSGKLLEPPGR